MKLYDKEKEWLKRRPKVEYCAAYDGDTLVHYKEGESKAVHLTREDLEAMRGNILTHWHPPDESMKLYGSEDAPFSPHDISLGITFGTEIRVVTTQSLRRFIFCKMSGMQKIQMEMEIDFAIDAALHFGIPLGKSVEATDGFWTTIAKRFNCTFEKISLIDLKNNP